MYFRVADEFLVGTAPPLEIKVTYLDTGSGGLAIDVPTAAGVLRAPAVTKHGSSAWRTATWRVTGARLDGSLGSGARLDGALADGADFSIRALGRSPLEVRFVRLVKAAP